MAILIVSIIFLTFAGDPRRTKVTSGHRRKDNYCEANFEVLPPFMLCLKQILVNLYYSL